MPCISRLEKINLQRDTENTMFVDSSKSPGEAKHEVTDSSVELIHSAHTH